MNERLEQLRLEASRYAKEQYPNDIVEWAMCMSERFAELIVKECAEFIACGEFGDPSMAKQMKNYFGVEE